MKTNFLAFLGMNEIILILLLVVLLFGAKKIPELMKGLGKGIKEFKSASQGETTEEDKNNQKLEK